MKPKPYFKLGKEHRPINEGAQEGLAVCDREGTIQYASPALRRLTGYSLQQLQNTAADQFIYPADLKVYRQIVKRVLATPGHTVTFTFQVLHKKGMTVWCEGVLTNLLNVPNVKAVIFNVRDISQKRVAKENFAQTKELLETINRNLEEGVFMGILGTKFLYVNEAFVKLMGYRSAAELMAVNPVDLYVDEDHRKQIVGALRKTGSMKGVETRLRRKNGEAFWVRLHVSMLEHEGKKGQYVGMVRDTTKEKQAELNLIESRNFLRNIINTVAAPIFVKNADHRWVMMNQKFCDLMESQEDQLLGKTDKHFVSAAEARIFWKIDDKVLKTGATIFNEERITSTKGTVHDLLTFKSRYVNENGQKFIIGFITDVTPLKKVEETIHQLNANLRGVLESTKESVYAVDTNLCYLMFNQNHKKIMKALYGATIAVGDFKIDYMKKSPDAVWVKAEIQKALKGNIFISEHYLTYPKFKGYIQTTYNPIRDEKKRVKGVAVFVKDVTERRRFEGIIQSINANLRAVLESTSDRILAVDNQNRYITFNESHSKTVKRLFGNVPRVGDNFLKALPAELSKSTQAEIREALKGRQFSVEQKLPDDSIFETRYNPIYDDERKITGAALFIRDVTDQKRLAEKMRALNDELLQQNVQLARQEEELKTTLEELSERNFELDQLMYKTSHDLRSPLSSIMGLVSLANLDKDTASRDSYLAKISGRIKKLDDFIRSMLDYARVNRVEILPETIDLHGLAGSCIRELEYLDNFQSIQTDIHVRNAMPFKSDPLRLKIIFSNIISNSYKYWNAEVNSTLKVELDVRADNAMMEFQDNGIGIQAEHMDKIFNMFYRATERSQGSGLGMYIVKQAVERLKGNVTISSEYGKGTRIRVVLPNMQHGVI